MPNLTISIDAGTYRNARIAAARLGTSISALVRNFLGDAIEEAGGVRLQPRSQPAAPRTPGNSAPAQRIDLDALEAADEEEEEDEEDEDDDDEFDVNLNEDDDYMDAEEKREFQLNLAEVHRMMEIVRRDGVFGDIRV